MSHETIRLEEWTGLLQNKLVAVWQAPDAQTPWLPSEFLLTQYITRILITGRQSPLSVALAADPSWTQVWRAPGGKEWSVLLAVLQHMPGPVLVVVGPDMPLSAKLVGSLQGVRSMVSTTVIVVRVPGVAGWVGDAADQVFLPVIELANIRHGGLLSVVNEWAQRASPKHLDTKTLLPQLTAQGYALTVADGAWHWYRPADSTGIATLTVPQIARQLHILGALLELS
jgi:hypothetical protein